MLFVWLYYLSYAYPLMQSIMHGFQCLCLDSHSSNLIIHVTDYDDDEQWITPSKRPRKKAVTTRQTISSKYDDALNEQRKTNILLNEIKENQELHTTLLQQQTLLLQQLVKNTQQRN